MYNILVYVPETPSEELELMLNSSLDNFNYIYIDSLYDITKYETKKLLIAVELDNCGFNITLFNELKGLYKINIPIFEGITCAMLIHSPSQLYTKSSSQNIIFLMNTLGCTFIGHPIVECTSDYQNFLTWQKTINKPLPDICSILCKSLTQRLFSFDYIKFKAPAITVLHSSSSTSSNSLLLWNMIKKYMTGCTIDEIYLENGTIYDCKGCTFTECIHYSRQSGCFYGGNVVREVFPSIEKSDAVVWICPNYNDSLSANLLATINRLTALYRKINFYDKYLFGIVVSGNSGSDSVAKQLIGALNINKGFILPKKFCIMESANDAGAILLKNDINENAQQFAKNMLCILKEL